MKRREMIKSTLVTITASVFAGGMATLIAFDPRAEWCVEWTLVYNAMTEKPDHEASEAANRLIQKIKDAGIWDKLEFLYVGPGMPEARNWKKPYQEIT